MREPPFAFPSDRTDGMTMREWYAGQVVIGMLSESGCAVAADRAKEAGITDMECIAKIAFEIADALIAQGSK